MGKNKYHNHIVKVTHFSVVLTSLSYATDLKIEQFAIAYLITFRKIT
ncbi:hypothetical protein NIES2100_01550 [Calothrix sp. NIES-2100]|nr:hypothetical protein NIES2100_01550 [Calothrix sp. NIES-2100]